MKRESKRAELLTQILQWSISVRVLLLLQQLQLLCVPASPQCDTIRDELCLWAQSCHPLFEPPTQQGKGGRASFQACSSPQHWEQWDKSWAAWPASDWRSPALWDRSLVYLRKQSKPELGMYHVLLQQSYEQGVGRDQNSHPSSHLCCPEQSGSYSRLINAHLEQNVGLWSSNRETREMGNFKQWKKIQRRESLFLEAILGPSALSCI